ncbi:hypothetical protein DPMN_062665 [Dreissena polymorpha]|uniref:Uncharacterized protein n=1 Tax=Dreissena polymorpha TaxID=45954 RepID=A0A9D4CA08_DREPO|nr:hypothetical protein DPMN_062665 [Dreissena polymorpha]
MILGISALELSSRKHLVDGRTDMSKTIYPLFFERGGGDILRKLPPSQKPCYLTDRNHFERNSRIKETNVLSKFHENWAKNVTSTVFTCFHYYYTYRENAPPTGGHVFSPIPTIFRLVRDINKNIVWTNFHDVWAKIVTSRVFVRENCHNIHIEKNAPPTGGHVFSPISTIFKLVRDINLTNILTDFHDDWTKIVTSRVFTRFLFSQLWKTAPSTGGHVFQRILLNSTKISLRQTFLQNYMKIGLFTSFELCRDFVGTKLLTKFHEDGTRNQMLTDERTDGHTTDKDRSQKLT